MLVKKIISLSLITALSLQSLNANSVLENVFQNKTPASQFEVKDSNGNTVKTMYYSGGYFFRFNNDATPQPLWNFSPPEIEAGCNGFNLKGMFMSLLGLDQFGAMLQNAGTSLAWGVAVGLIYSLPGVASVFKMINQWAKDIQKLLSMSCQAGIAIGEALGNKIGKGYNKKKVEESLMFGLDADAVSNAAQDKLPTLLKDGLGLDGVDFKWESGFSFSGGKEQSKDKKKDALASPLNRLFADTSIGGAMFFDYIMSSPKTMDEIKSVVKSEQSPLFYKRVVIDYGSGDGKFSGDTLEESISSIQANIANPIASKSKGLKFFAYALLYNFNGDRGYTTETTERVIKKMGDTFMCSSANDTTPSGCTPEKKNANDKILFTQLQNPSFSVKSGLVGNISAINGVQLKNLVLNGYSQDTKDFIKEMVAPEFVIVSGKETNKIANNFIVTPTTPVKKVPFFGNKEFAGAKTVSKCSLYKTVKGKIDENYIEALNQTGINGVTCDSIPTTIFKEIDIYVDLLSKATESEIVKGLRKIVDVNSYLTSRAIFDEIASNLAVSQVGGTPKIQAEVNLTPSNDMPIGDASTVDATDTLKSFSEVVKDAKTQLEKDYPKAQEGVEGLQKYFEELEQKIKTRSLNKQL